MERHSFPGQGRALALFAVLFVALTITCLVHVFSSQGQKWKRPASPNRNRVTPT